MTACMKAGDFNGYCAFEAAIGLTQSAQIEYQLGNVDLSQQLLVEAMQATQKARRVAA